MARLHAWAAAWPYEVSASLLRAKRNGGGSALRQRLCCYVRRRPCLNERGPGAEAKKARVSRNTVSYLICLTLTSCLVPVLRAPWVTGPRDGAPHNPLLANLRRTDIHGHEELPWAWLAPFYSCRDRHGLSKRRAPHHGINPSAVVWALYIEMHLRAARSIRRGFFFLGGSVLGRGTSGARACQSFTQAGERTWGRGWRREDLDSFRG